MSGDRLDLDAIEAKWHAATLPRWVDERADALALVAEVRRLRALALDVVQADDDSVSYEPCGDCLKSGVALLDGASYDRRDAAVEAPRTALP